MSSLLCGDKNKNKNKARIFLEKIAHWHKILVLGKFKEVQHKWLPNSYWSPFYQVSRICINILLFFDRYFSLEEILFETLLNIKYGHISQQKFKTEFTIL